MELGLFVSNSKGQPRLSKSFLSCSSWSLVLLVLLACSAHHVRLFCSSCSLILLVLLASPARPTRLSCSSCLLVLLVLIACPVRPARPARPRNQERISTPELTHLVSATPNFGTIVLQVKYCSKPFTSAIVRGVTSARSMGLITIKLSPK
jgi:hypothetical protein